MKKGWMHRMGSDQWGGRFRMKWVALWASAGTVCLCFTAVLLGFYALEMGRFSWRHVESLVPLLNHLWFPVFYLLPTATFFVIWHLFPLYFPNSRWLNWVAFLGNLAAAVMYVYTLGKAPAGEKGDYLYPWFAVNGVLLNILLVHWVYGRASPFWKWTGALLFPSLYVVFQ